MEDKSTNKSALDFDLDEIKASINKTKEETSAVLDKIVFPSSAEPGSATGSGFTMTPSEPKTEQKESMLEMNPEVKSPESDAELPKVELVMEPESAAGPASGATEGPGFVMTPSEPKEEKQTSSDFNMEASKKVDSSESLEKDFTLIDKSREVEKASSEYDKAQDEAAGIGKSISSAGSYSTKNASESLREGSASPSPAQVRSGSGSQHYASKPSKPKKEKKYVTRGTLIGCMILTMLLSTFLGSLLGGTFGKTSGSYNENNRTERDDSKLSQLDLSDATGSELTVAQIVDKNEDAVVEIVVSGTMQGMWGQMQLTEGAGSGVIVREDGYIATNYHVIQGANKVQVTLHNGDAYPASIVGSDPSNDVAVIKIDATGLTTAEIGDSSKVEVGDLAVAIGNPLGQLGGSVTTGIISALDRTLTVEGTTLTLLQTDAAINGGNSGGGLFNARGELIGIVESKASAVGVEGLAFALPINSVAEIINNIIETGGDVSGSIAGTPAVGVVISDVSEEQSEYYGLSEPGVYIAQVTGENAMKAGFKEQDRIVSFNGKKISNSSDFITLVRKCKVGDTVTVVVSRQGQEIEIKTVLEELQINE